LVPGPTRPLYGPLCPVRHGSRWNSNRRPPVSARPPASEFRCRELERFTAWQKMESEDILTFPSSRFSIYSSTSQPPPPSQIDRTTYQRPPKPEDGAPAVQVPDLLLLRQAVGYPLRWRYPAVYLQALRCDKSSGRGKKAFYHHQIL